MVQQLRPSQLAPWCAQLATQGRRPVVLDVREAWEVQTASVQANGFDLVHIPLALLPARVQDLQPGTPVACLCHHGARSMRAAHFLVDRGFSQVINLAGGIDAWSQECDPSVPCY